MNTEHVQGDPGMSSGVVFFYDARTGQDVTELFDEVERHELKPGGSIRVRKRNKSKATYRIQDVQDGFHTKVTVRRVVVHPLDILQLIIIALLCYFVFEAFAVIFTGDPDRFPIDIQ